MKRHIPKLIEEIELVRYEPLSVRVVDEIVSKSEYYDDDVVVEALCYVIAGTKNEAVRSHAISVIDKVKNR
jgi:hypothetical protein